MKAKIAKRLLLLCVALTIAVVITFGRRDDLPKISKTSAPASDSLSLRKTANPRAPAAPLGSLDQAIEAKPSTELPSIPVFGPPSTKKEDATPVKSNLATPRPSFDKLADLPDLPNLMEATPPKPTTTPLPPLLAFKPADSVQTKDEEQSKPELADGLPTLPDLSSAKPETSQSDAKGLSMNLDAPEPRALAQETKGQELTKPLTPSDSADHKLPPPFSLPAAALTQQPPPKKPRKTDTTDTTDFQPPSQPAKTRPPVKLAQRPPSPLPALEPLSSPSPTPPLSPPTTPKPDALWKSNTPPTTPKLVAPAPLTSRTEPADSGMPKMPTAPPIATRSSQSAAPRGARYHRIIDGDTLDSISQRYLGSADRAMEIFHANRQVLQTPDILPLNAKLVVPSQTSRPMSASTQSHNRMQTNRTMPTSLPSDRADPFLRPTTDSRPPATRETDPQLHRPALPPLPPHIENGRVQNLQPETRLVPVPAG